MKKVVVFDTGIGGRLFADYLSKYPGMEIETVIDTDNSPYGTKSKDEIVALTEAAVGDYIDRADAIILACNTATAVAIDELRDRYPDQVFIGFEPMIKTAAELSKTGKVMVLATRATKEADRYKRLKERFSEIAVIEPDCDLWATQIDNGNLDVKDIKNTLEGQLEGIDVIILACTHYVAVSDQIQQIVGPDITVINPFEAVSNYIEKIFLKKPLTQD